MNKFIKSPLNYTGNKYRLLPQLIPLFPTDIHTFVDMFCGSATVAANVFSDKTICVDVDKHVIELLQKFKDTKTQTIIQYIHEQINKYGLSMTNKDAFINFRTKYNRDNSNVLDLYVLICFAFNHQIRFNNKGQYNMPAGTNRSEYSQTMENNLIAFCDSIKNKDIEFVNQSFTDFDINMLSENDMIYCDPPYLITSAVYNDGYDENSEKQLLAFLDKCNANRINFALSNVFTTNNKTNDILIEWSKKYNIHHLNYDYHNSNYHRRDKTKSMTDEVLITNY